MVVSHDYFSKGYPGCIRGGLAQALFFGWFEKRPKLRYNAFLTRE